MNIEASFRVFAYIKRRKSGNQRIKTFEFHIIAGVYHIAVRFQTGFRIADNIVIGLNVGAVLLHTKKFLILRIIKQRLYCIQIIGLQRRIITGYQFIYLRVGIFKQRFRSLL